MRVAIIVFSPSGNTKKIAAMLAESLQQRNAKVQTIDITGDREFFNGTDPIHFLQERIDAHDVLCLGAPVYCHRFQYHLMDLIRSLPKPDGHWGSIAVPFVTYGGVTSGIALEEAGKLLRKSGRTVPAGMKVAGSHCMSDPILGYEFNKGCPNSASLPLVEQLAERIMHFSNGTPCADASSTLAYQSRLFSLKTKIIFQEKVWHKKRYPSIAIDSKICINCGKCAKRCPVRHLTKTPEGIRINEKSDCIHCLNCMKGCPKQSISLVGDLERGRAFFTRLIEKHGNEESPESAIFPLKTCVNKLPAF
jgi:ferredoxin/NAD(P)H-dependent FMN reductase